MVAILGAAILEMIGCSFILPAAACDLNLSNSIKGIITSIPNIGRGNKRNIFKSYMGGYRFFPHT